MVAFTLGTQIQAVVVAWQVYELTKDPLSLGLVGLAEAVPFIGSVLYAGHIADLHDRKLIAIAASALQVLCAIALLMMTLDPNLLIGNVWLIFGVVALSGLARSFLAPSRNALAAEIVPRETYTNAIAWRTSLWQFGSVVGPALGGLIYGFSGVKSAYATEVVLCMLGLLLFIKIGYQRQPKKAQEGTLGSNLTIGMRFLLKQPQLIGAKVLD
jgi:MFS family permease